MTKQFAGKTVAITGAAADISALGLSGVGTSAITPDTHTLPAGALPRFENDLTLDTVRVGLKWRM